jgi:hypothetical protein
LNGKETEFWLTTQQSMKTTNDKNHPGLDIRFIPIDSMDPRGGIDPFTKENAELVTQVLHRMLAHIADEISETNGYINVYTSGNAVVGKPQFVNFSKNVWDKLMLRPGDVPHAMASNVDEEKDHLQHKNYADF